MNQKVLRELLQLACTIGGLYAAPKLMKDNKNAPMIGTIVGSAVGSVLGEVLTDQKKTT